jgi:hypothetical protein
MDNLLAGILVSSLKKSQDTLVIPRQLSLSVHRFRGGRLHRNGWPLSNGMGGRLPPESVAGLDRNTQSSTEIKYIPFQGGSIFDADGGSIFDAYLQL